MTLQQKLNKHIEKYCLSGAETARRTGLHVTQVSDIRLHNKYSPAIAEKIYKALGNDFREYFEYSVCSYCGSEYIPKNNRQKTCEADECKLKNKKIIEKEYRRKVHSGEHVMRTYNERRQSHKKYLELSDSKPKQSIPEFMNGKQYGDRQREYLLSIQKTQRMGLR